MSLALQSQRHNLGTAPPMHVHFFIEPVGISLERARTLDPDAEWQDMRRGKERWIVQTYARLRKAGRVVSLTDQVPSSGVLVYHKEEHRLVLSRMTRGACPVLVAIRADFRSADSADFEVLQNGYYADDQRCFFVPLWPQPGLVPRDPSRGGKLENIAFKGNLDNLLPELRSDDFRQKLARENMSFGLDAANVFDTTRPMQQNWHDYSNVDAVLALRPVSAREHTHKPATKLYNAWLAGVPAILTPDYAFNELRRSNLDFLEARTPDEAFAALVHLKNTPDLYRRMVDNGRERGRDFSVPALTARWETLLFETLPRLAAEHPRWRYSPNVRRIRGWRRKIATTFAGVRK